MSILRVFLILLAMLPAGLSAKAQTSEGCSALAGALGSQPTAEALEAARTACAMAVLEEPGNSPLLHFYARTLELSGDLEGAARLYQWAADDGYGPAVQALARLAGEPAEAAEPAETAAANAAGPSDSAAAETAESTEAGAVGPTLADAADQLDQLAALLEKAQGLLPRTSFDPAAVIAEVGTDPQALAEWVATQTALVPYRGRLRGPVGVLLDRYGNSLDRALLLAALLAEAGHEAVLVHGTLSEADATHLLAVRPQPPALPADDRTREAVLAELGIDPAADTLGLADAMAKGADEAAAARNAVLAQARNQGDALLALVASAAAPASARAGEIEALRDHWWVRIETSAGGQDLDPSGASAAATRIEQLSPGALPPELSHAVALSVVAEFLQADGTLRGETLLSHRLVPADLVGVPVLLWHEPIGLPGPSALWAMGDLTAIEHAIVGERAWQPALLIGDEIVADRIATVDGITLPGDREGVTAARQPLRDVEGAISGQLSGFSAAMNELSAPVEEVPAASLVAIRLEFEITAPGVEPILHSRAVFDLLEPAARASHASGAPVSLVLDESARRLRAQALLEQIDIGLWGATPSASFIADIAVREMLPLYRKIVPVLISGTVPNIEQLPALGDLPRTQVMLLSFAAARAGVASAVSVILDHPNVMLLRQGHRLASNGSATGYAMIDIVENGVAQVSAPAGGAFAARLRQGVADTALEAAMLGAPDPRYNTSALFAADLAAGRDWTVLAHVEDIAMVDLPPQMAAQVRHALAVGHLAAVPPPGSISGTTGWWRIDAGLGTTLGMSATGSGASMVEYVIILGKTTGMAICAAKMFSAMSQAQGADQFGAFLQAHLGGMLCILGAQFSTMVSVDKYLFAASSGAEALAMMEAMAAVMAAAGGLVMLL